MIKSGKIFSQLFLLLLLAGLGVACKDEAVDPVIGQDPDLSAQAKINDWIYRELKTYYLWSDELPAKEQTNLDQDPSEYFKGLKSSKDRFSFLTPDYEALMKSLEGVSLDAGYEFSLTRASQDNNDLWAFVVYVKPGSPAKEAGLKRGDVITHINNQQITRDNFKSLLGQLSSTHSIRYGRYNEATAKLEAQPELSLNTIELSENPHFMDTVYTLAGGKKVGYYVYNFFSPGTSSANEYDQQMENIIAGFKSKGVNELVLDLRYNSGGSLSSARHLASLIGRNVNSSKIFYENRWNTEVQKYIATRKDADEILRGRFLDKTANIGNNLASGTVYILTDFRTASASEMIINGLKPYMNVVLIGAKTVGKNVGSIPIQDKENPENTYGMLPIVIQIHNSQGSSDYADGFVPNVAVSDLALPMKPLGDTKEALLATALAYISGDSGAKIAGDKPMSSSGKFEPIGSSLERKAWTNRVVLDEMPAAELMPF